MDRSIRKKLYQSRRGKRPAKSTVQGACGNLASGRDPVDLSMAGRHRTTWPANFTGYILSSTKPSSISTTGYLVLPNLKRKRGNFTLNSTIRDKFLCTFQEFRALVCHAPIAVSVANHGFLFGGPVFLCGQLPCIESPNDSGG